MHSVYLDLTHKRNMCISPEIIALIAEAIVCVCVCVCVCVEFRTKVICYMHVCVRVGQFQRCERPEDY